MKHHFTSDFLLCGVSGWCMECAWTGIGSMLGKDKALNCHTSIWMFPIYGMAACLSPLTKTLASHKPLFRGTVYMLCIYSAEYITGTILKKYNACPWDYSKSKYQYKGVIRLDYAPAWFAAGLFFEKLLTRPN